MRGWRLAENPGAELERRKGIAAAKFLVAEKIDRLLTKEIGEGPFHLLRDSLVEIYRIPDGLDSTRALEAFREKRLEMMTSPSRLRPDTPIHTSRRRHQGNAGAG
ncbi:NifB/NifX family molybdenum-iron cluster-binding protein [Candidatus Bathyarchaeota archaeon]|nr:NifB/NifX family molybdenum-iron cluster-binding protein [Candidatus Bathyarchaeota archaeon]